MRDRLYYNGKEIHDLRDVRIGGVNYAEIKILVPRTEIKETLDESIETTNDIFVAGKITEGTICIDESAPDEATIVVVATNKNKQENLGVEDSPEFLDSCKKFKFDPNQVKNALNGVIKTHKGYGFFYSESVEI